jgi:hypothetical protein
LFCVRSKIKGEVRLDDNKIHIFGARRADVTGVGAWEPHVEDLALPKSLKSGNFTLAKALIRWMSDKLNRDRRRALPFRNSPDDEALSRRSRARS